MSTPPLPFDVESGEASLDFKPYWFRGPAGISLSRNLSFIQAAMGISFSRRASSVLN